MVMLSKFSNFPDELSKNDELREYELNGSDCKISLMNNWSELPENLTKGFSAGLKCRQHFQIRSNGKQFYNPKTGIQIPR